LSPPQRRKRATSSSSRPIAVAITGGIGAGKSEALKAFARHGAAVISSDEIVHRLIREDERVKRAMVERLGPEILGEDGQIDRSLVAKVVFGDRDALLWLEQLLHPLVSLEYLRWRDELAQTPDPPALAVTEVPLLYEAGSQDRFDKVVLITAPRKLAAARARVFADERSDRLIPDEEKARGADFVYVNDGSLEELDAFVAGVVKELRAPREPEPQ
jgi:dephospho-CoA kinase